MESLRDLAALLVQTMTLWATDLMLDLLARIGAMPS